MRRAMRQTLGSRVIRRANTKSRIAKQLKRREPRPRAKLNAMERFLPKETQQ